jgi:hypothetical protein
MKKKSFLQDPHQSIADTMERSLVGFFFQVA